ESSLRCSRELTLRRELTQVAEVTTELLRGWVACARVALESPRDHLHEPPRERVLTSRRQRGGFHGELGAYDVHRGEPGSEHRRRGEGAKEQRPESVEVRCWFDLTAAHDLLGRHVPEGPDDIIGVGAVRQVKPLVRFVDEG